MNQTPMKQLFRLRMLIVLLMTGLPLHGGEFFYTIDNSAGTGQYLLGSILLPDASYSSHKLSMSRELSSFLRAYGELNSSRIYPHTEYSSTQGELGLQFRYLDVKNTQFYGGLFYVNSTYHEDFSYYDRSSLGAYTKVKYYIKPGQLLTTGVDLYQTTFPEVETASNTEKEIYLTYNQSFRSGTSLKLSSNLMSQSFFNQNSAESAEPPDLTLMKAGVRLSQSLGPKIGLTVWLERQKHLEGSSSLILTLDDANNPFIDRFRWQGPSYASRLIYRLTESQSITLSHSLADKEFLEVPVYAYDFDSGSYLVDSDGYLVGGEDRKDLRSSTNLSWTLFRDFYTNSWLAGLDLTINYGLLVNSSNDPIYDYSSHSGSLSINFNN